MLSLAGAVGARRAKILSRRIGPINILSKFRGPGVDGAEQALQNILGLWEGLF